MINIYQFYQELLDRLNKEENGYLKTAQFNRLVNHSSVQYQKDLVKSLQDANEVDKHQLVLDMLLPFNMRAVIPTQAFGMVAAPKDYAHFAALRVLHDLGASVKRIIELNNQLCEGEDDPTVDTVLIQQEIDEIQNEERYIGVVVYPHEKLAKRLNSAIPTKRPTINKPVAEYAPGGWKIYPSLTASALLVYYRKPAEAKLVMKIDAATEDLVVDETASVDLEWGDNAKEGLLKRMIADFAIYVREGELFQMNNSQSEPKQ